MMIEAVFEKCMSIPTKVVGQVCAISCVLIEVFTKTICLVMQLFMKWQSIINEFHLLSFLLWFAFTSSDHEPKTLYRCHAI